MGFLDDMQGTFDRGVSAAKGAVSSMAGEQLGFVRGFTRMCDRGSIAGFHERNGGNASYRLSADDTRSMRSFFYDNPSSWVALGVSAPEMAGEFLLVSGSGKHLANMASDPVANAGIVEIDATGSAWRVVWGLKGGARPTSEISAHVAAHEVRKRTKKACEWGSVTCALSCSPHRARGAHGARSTRCPRVDAAAVVFVHRKRHRDSWWRGCPSMDGSRLTRACRRDGERAAAVRCLRVATAWNHRIRRRFRCGLRACGGRQQGCRRAFARLERPKRKPSRALLVE